ncbi:MAG: AAA family ATPase [Bacteroidales bacterium]|nr:AAA family ATPase [Bacteroidales bacterium]
MPETSWMTALEIKNVRHLKDLYINFGSDAMRHLMLTGPNGVGKTSVLNALFDHLVALAEDSDLQFKDLEKSRAYWQERILQIDQTKDPHGFQTAKNQLSHQISRINRFWGAVRPTYTDESAIPFLYNEQKFVIAYYSDFRQSRFVAPTNPEKPNLKFKIRDNKVNEFLKFLVDLKVQQALARNEGNIVDAEDIEGWFTTFVCILRELFHDNELALKFDYHDYSFLIETLGRSFPFTALSAGYSAALDIVADLILKMQATKRHVRVFDRPGIVLIDEIEKHLHLSLQKEILPILTRIFPRIQFIVTTYSPFVLNSIKNAVVYDLVSKQTIEDLTDYSYSSLAEGYFGVETESGDLKGKLDELSSLIEEGDVQSKEKIERVFAEFEKIPDAIAPKIKARCSDLHRKYYSRIAEV